jgi:hypothetical protein
MLLNIDDTVRSETFINYITKKNKSIKAMHFNSDPHHVYFTASFVALGRKLRVEAKEEGPETGVAMGDAHRAIAIILYLIMLS